MGPRTSCIERPAEKRFVCFREEYLEICGGDHCAALLLSTFEYLTNGKMWNQEPGDDHGIHVSYAEMEEMMLGLYRRTAIIRGVENLVKLGFLRATTPERRELKILYHLLFQAVNQALVPSSKNGRCSGGPSSENGCTQAEYTSENGRSYKEKKEVRNKESGGGDTTQETTPTPLSDQGELEHFLDKHLRAFGYKPVMVSPGLRKQLKRLDRQVVDRESFRKGLSYAIYIHDRGGRQTMGQAIFAFREQAEAFPKVPQQERRQSGKSTQNVGEATKGKGLSWIEEFERKEAERSAQKSSKNIGTG